MLVIGLTGGIGSGKSAVSDLFAKLGITIVDADVAARVVVEPGKPALTKIAEHFGQEIIDASGALDRRALREKVFNDESERKWLEALTHPLIAKEIADQIQASQSPYTILVSPLLFEAKQDRYVKRVLLVDVPVELQIARTVTRDETTEDGVKAIVAAQMDRETRLSKADDVIVNDQDFAHLENEVARFHQQYLELAEQ